MTNQQFVHLHTHTQYSLLDGAARYKDLVARAAEYGMPALAMTDHGNMSGAVNFFRACKGAGIKPIIGCEVYLAPGSRFEKSGSQKGTSHLILLAKDNDGYRNLIKLVSKGYLDGFYYKPRVDKELLAQHHKGLICSSACLKGEVNWHLWHDNYAAARQSAGEFKDIFGDDYYLEIADHGIPEQKIVMEGMVKLSKELDIPIVATNDIHYLDQEQAEAQDLLLCIQMQTTVNDPNRMRSKSDQLYFKSPQEMRELFSWIPEACDNTLVIAEKCNMEIDFDTYHLPKFHPPKGLTDAQYLNQLCEEGIHWRYGKSTPEIDERLKHELKIITEMGFISYFLIVSDFCQYARKQGIPVGPGRGSAAGSIVAYLLGITDLCPLKYDLLFERFLNPSRAGMPDIDIDFCYERRPEVIEYVTEKYGGEENVAQIITFGTLQAKAAIRDVGRALGMAYADVDRVAKLVPNELGITLEKALDMEPQLRELCETDETVGKLMQNARVLEGLMRHASTHAAGVVIFDEPLTDHVPLFKTSDGQVSCAYTMDGIDSIGLLKMDFLGLRTLTVINDAIKIIKQTRGVDIDWNDIPLDDQNTYDMLGRGDSLGVFQLESPGMRELLRKLKPTVFEDIIAVLALYRPGPMGSGMLDDFTLRKNGQQEIKYPHPKLEECLKQSYGIILYQEQVMQIPVILAGFELPQADNLRRAMSKKKYDVMQEMRADFVKGCQTKSGMTEKESNDLFDLIDYFSGYGFNKSHSAAYAMVTYQTAYLKANYPIEFMCALLTSERDNTDKVVEYVNESQRMGITVLPPDVNASFKNFAVKSDHEIFYGLLAVKNVGSNAIQSLVDEREKHGPYTSLFDFCRRVDLRLNNNRVIESLIKSGCFSSVPGLRSQQLAVLDKAVNLGSNAQKEKEVGQMSFFSMDGGDDGFGSEDESYPDLNEWPQAQVLSYEKELLGFYLSGHPLDRYKVEIRHFSDVTTKKLASATEDQAIKLVAMIKYIKLTSTKRTGDRMALVRVEDMEGEVETVIFPKAYEKIAPVLKDGAVVVIQGKVNIRDGSIGLIVDNMYDINEVYRLIREVHIDLSKTDKTTLEQLKKKLIRFPGRVPVHLRMNTSEYKGVEIKVGRDLFVSPSEILMDEIKQLVGEDCFSVKL